MPAAGDHDGAVGRLGDRVDRLGPPSMSVSLARTSIALARRSSTTVGRVIDRTGASSTAVDGDRHGGQVSSGDAVIGRGYVKAVGAAEVAWPVCR